LPCRISVFTEGGKVKLATKTDNLIHSLMSRTFSRSQKRWKRH
jgi:hypothetical protein